MWHGEKVGKCQKLKSVIICLMAFITDFSIYLIEWEILDVQRSNIIKSPMIYNFLNYNFIIIITIYFSK